ncbi:MULTISPECIES: nitrous oxide reductase accessory protein NosL [Halolamina]|uniref:Nitrous oxide reductase accessory protein NosL n=1 Tax=Halolamina pelagica TaxID=699431 RepID=A0A1I5PX37_9EURY|nr:MULTISPECIES: nitrous oxide reductase accessory protein NosL [Halolamina]NHX34974.1 nitrous oxide reductase accessory protein NosL [Halolamina sp. R1-12]SFP38201.1 Nitrous oxide reductase accessory protein NosL [Halolamina pelagica]
MTPHEHDHGDHSSAASTDASCTRRHAIAASVGLTVGLAGCLGGDGDAPAAVTLPEDATCDVCGMVISQHPGPTAEVFYADQRPGGHDNPARFDSTWEAFQFDFEHEDWSREAFYVTDYSVVDYEIRTDGDQQVISTHYGAESFVDATTVTFVAGSSVVGAMGEDLIGFADEGDAESFQAEHGGDIVTFDEVTPELLSTLGR